MIIKRLELKDFRSTKHEIIEAGRGIYVFSANNGNGKSNFLYAIALLFFNYTIKTIGDYVNWDAKSFYIACTFIHSEKEHEIYIKYANNTERVLTIGGEEKPYIGQDAIDKMKELFDPKLALASMIAFEGEIDLISIGDAERREMCRKIYDVDFTYAVKELEEDLDVSKKRINFLENEIRHLEEKKYEYIAKQRPPFTFDIFNTKKDDLKDLRKKREDILIEIQQVSRIREDIGKKESDILDLNNTIKNLNSKITDIEKEITELKNGDLESEFKAKKETLAKSVEAEKQVINGTLLKYNEDIKVLKENLIPTESLNSELNYIDDEITKLNKDLAYFQADLKDLHHKKELCKKGICPECGQKVEKSDDQDFDLDIDLVRGKISEWEQQIASLQKNRVRVSQEITDNSDRILKVNSMETGIKSLNEKLEVVDKNYNSELIRLDEEKSDKKSNNNKLISTYESTLTEYQKLLTDNQAKLQKCTKDIEDLKNKLPAEIPKTSEFDTMISQLELDISSYEAILIENNKAQEINDKIDRDKKDDAKKKIEYEKERENLSIDLTFTEKAIKVLKRDFPSYILSIIIKSLERQVNKFLNSTYDGRYKIKMKQTKTGLEIVYGPREKDVRLASGYERQVFSMAYKYAMGSVQDYKVLFLDEVDSAASDENSLKFYETIGNMKALYNQLWIITHKEVAKELLEKEYSATVFTLQNGEII